MLTIGAIAQQAGIATSAVRYYERIGLLPKSERVNGQRRFDPAIVQWLKLIQFAQQAGFTLDEINTLFHGFAPDTPPAERWQGLAQQKLIEIEQLIQQANLMKRMLQEVLRCGCLNLEECVTMVNTHQP